MLEGGKINKHQFKVFIVLTFIGTSILNTPTILAADAKQDAWIACILGVVMGLFVILLYNTVANLMGNRTLVEYIQDTLGKWTGKIVSIWFVVFLLLNSSSIIWIVGNFISTQIMPETPMLVINSLFTIVIIIGTRLGIEVIMRTAETLYPWAIGGTIILFVLLLPEINFKNIQPILESGIKPLFKATIIFQGFVSLTFVAFLMVFPAFSNDLKDGKKAFLLGMLTGGIIIILLTAFNILILGSDSTARNIYPSYVIVKRIKIGPGIERIEAVIAMVWIIAIFFKAVLYFYAGVLGTAQILSLKDYRVLTLPLGIIVVILTIIIYPNVTYASKWDTSTWLAYVSTNGLILPLLLIMISKFRK